MANQLVKDGIVSESDTQAKALWRLREDTPVSLSSAGAVYKYDLSMPTRSMYAIVEDMKNVLPSEFQVFGYGHIGDGNLHLNILVPRFDPSRLIEACYGLASDSIAAGMMKNTDA
jgi:FAD/FMN-containing dehydrogenase